MLKVLIVEDGDEYIDNLSRFVSGPQYVQAKNGRDAVKIVKSYTIDIIYLDMRFDRIANCDLLGDHVKATKEHNGDPLRALKFIQNNQGLFILEHFRNNGLASIPVILAYDFSREVRRFEYLKRIHSSLVWVKDAVTPSEIRKLFSELTSVQSR